MAGLAAVEIGHGTAVAVPAERIVGLGFETVVDHPDQLPDIAAQLDSVQASGVSVAVGRTDWSAFPWPGNPDAWSSMVKSSGSDYVAQALKLIGTDHHGQRRQVTAVIDTLVSGWIGHAPAIAGISADGQRSDSFASLSQLATGPVGQRLISFVAAVAARYHPQWISLTELFADTYTFGPDDLAFYRALTGAADWPRTASGAINTADPRIGTWRSQAIASVVARARDAAHAQHARLETEVRADWSDPTGDDTQEGQNYPVLLAAADRLVIWDYFGLSNRPAAYTEQLARAATTRAPGRFVISVGLWATHGTISATDLQTAVRAAKTGGVNAVWITPASLIDVSDCAALQVV